MTTDYWTETGWNHNYSEGCLNYFGKGVIITAKNSGVIMESKYGTLVIPCERSSSVHVAEATKMFAHTLEELTKNEDLVECPAPG